MSEERNAAEMAAGLSDTPGYRYADRVGDRLFVAGQVPTDSDGGILHVGDPGAQARRCLDNLRTVVEVNGFAVADVHRLTVHVVGEHENLLNAWVAVRDWFGGDVPPATLLGAHLLGFTDQLVEIDADIIRA
ncbi:MAG: RidA family protein [Actinomycetota bacterium]